jgi:hypothetical protein
MKKYTILHTDEYGYKMTFFEKALEVLNYGLERFIEFTIKCGLSERWWGFVVIHLFLLPEYWLATCFWIGHRILKEYDPEKYGNTDRWLFYERESTYIK